MTRSRNSARARTRGAASPPGSDLRAGEPPFVVDMDRLNDEGGRALSALGILEAVEACIRASEMVERLDGTCIHDDDWGEEKLVHEPGRISGDSDEGYTALVDARNVRNGRSFLSRKARKAKREYIEK